MDPKFVVGYLKACLGGELSYFECIPLLEVVVTVALFIAAVVLFVTVRIPSNEQMRSDTADSH